ncbi:MAG: RNA 3'-terminal phosphate cyclase [Myxococcaceae bacterium]
MVELDGSQGEGGGQILRTALTLSLITGRPFEITHIRANRRPPGLRPQHLACVRGAEAISGGRSEGAHVDADHLVFEPGATRAGDYELDVGSAGSTPLLLQCLFFPLALAGGGSLLLRGGTHLPHSPTYHYLSWIWAPTMAAYGLGIDLQLRYAGFYPQGGGELRAAIPPPGEPPSVVDLPARGTLRDVHVTSFVGGLPFQIAERQAKAAVSSLREHGINGEAEKLPLPTMRSVGTTVFVRAQFENTAAGFSALGERGRRAEEVGGDAAAQMIDFMQSAGALDEHLADQILIPAALLAAGRLGSGTPGETLFTTSRVTNHLTTNATVLEQFLPIRIEVSPSAEIRVRPS